MYDSITTIYIPINFGSGEKYNYDFYYITNNNKSILEDFTDKSRISRYIQEYTYFLFSDYIEFNNRKGIEAQDILNFFKENVEIDPNFIYPNSKTVAIILDKNSDLLKKGKVVVNDEETYKKLFFSLSAKSNNFPFYILSYYKEKFMRNYYLEKSDFQIFENQTIILGKENFLKETVLSGNKGYKKDRSIFYSVEYPIKINTCYFINNYILSKYNLLAKNFYELTSCRIVASNWIDNNIYSVKGSKLLSNYNLYKLENGKYIQKIISNNDIIIIMSKVTVIVEEKIKTKNMYTVCMPIKRNNCY